MKQLGHQFIKLMLIMLLSANCFAFTWSDFVNKIYGGVEGGYSFGNHINLQPTNNACTSTTACWTNPTQSFNADLENSPVYGAKIGYQINKLFTVDAVYDARNDFGWRKNFPSNPTGFNQPVKRFIGAIRNQTLMFDLYMTPNLQWSKLDPFFNAGMGWSWNRTGNLTNINLATGETAIISGNQNKTFAWNLGAGANFIVDEHIFFDAGYRFLSLGRIQTGTTVLSPLPVLPIARLRTDSAYANEVYAGINYLL